MRGREIGCSLEFFNCRTARFKAQRGTGYDMLPLDKTDSPQNDVADTTVGELLETVRLWGLERPFVNNCKTCIMQKFRCCSAGSGGRTTFQFHGRYGVKREQGRKHERRGP